MCLLDRTTLGSSVFHLLEKELSPMGFPFYHVAPNIPAFFAEHM